MSKKSPQLISALVAVTMSLGSIAAFANQGAGSDFVDEVKLTFTGQAAVIHVKNTSANKNVNAVNLAVQESKMDFGLSGTVYCDPGINVRFKGGYAFFGNLTLDGDGNVNASNTLHGQNSFSVAYQEKKNDPIEYVDNIFSVPLNKVKNGSAALKVDPVAELNKKLQQHINNGGKAVNFYRNEQQVVLQRPISIAGICGNNSKNSAGYYTKNHTIQIIYEGDKNVVDHKLNPQLGQQPGQIKLNAKPIPIVPMGGNGTIEAGYQPLQISQANILAETLSYTGHCPKELKFTVRIKGQGRGGVKYRVKDGITHIKSSGSMIFDEKGTWWQDVFTYTVKAEKMNQQVNHNFSLKVEYRDGQAQGMGWKEFNGTGLQWKHKCTPQSKFNMGQQQGGLQFNNNSNSQGMDIKVKPVQTESQGMKVNPIQTEPTQPYRRQD